MKKRGLLYPLPPNLPVGLGVPRAPGVKTPGTRAKTGHPGVQDPGHPGWSETIPKETGHPGVQDPGHPEWSETFSMEPGHPGVRDPGHPGWSETIHPRPGTRGSRTPGTRGGQGGLRLLPD